MQRGFNLVEMSIIMVVVGLVLGAVLIPSHALLEEDIYKEEERQLQRIKASILGYAVRHRTDGRGFRVDGGAPPHVYTDPQPSRAGYDRSYALPGGRPYLPCPDITGDGYEDRTYYDRTGFAFTPSITPDARNGRHIIGRKIEQAGSCFTTRGALPWRTLGVPPADHWGNIYTYQVDGVIADALTGFNQNSFLDKHDPRLEIEFIGAPDAYTYIARAGGGALSLTISLNGIDSEVASSLSPVVVCGGTLTVCYGNGNLLTLVAGVQVAEDIVRANQVFFHRAFFDLGDVISGLPFVILSHGANGKGAVNYNRNLQKALLTPAAVADGLACNSPITARADYDAADDEPESFNFPQLTGTLPGTLCSNTMVDGRQAEYGFMFYQPRNDNFDDVMLWGTFDEVLETMHEGGVLPAADWPLLRSL